MRRGEKADAGQRGHRSLLSCVKVARCKALAIQCRLSRPRFRFRGARMHVRLFAAALAGAWFASTAYGQLSVKGDPAKAQQLVTQVCAACHGTDGNSAI